LICAIIAPIVSVSTTGCGGGNNGGGCGSSCNVTAPSGTFSANPKSIMNGSSTTLSWTSENATSASIDNGVGSVTPVSSGSVKVSPTTTTTYTLTLTGSGGSVTYQAAVTVTSTGGALILYEAGATVNAVESNGSNSTQLVSGSYNGTWFANHQSLIAVANITASEFQIFATTGTETSTKLQSTISLPTISNAEFPTPSPDGSTILFIGSTIPNAGVTQQGVYTIKADGTGLTGPLYQSPLGTGVALDRARWSHDGKYIVHERVDTTGHSEVWVMNTDGTNPRQVTNIPSTNNSLGAFSADDTTIFFSECVKGSSCQIWKIAAAGTPSTEALVLNNAIEPVPSSDGKFIVYVEDVPGQTTSPIFVSDVNGNNQQQIVANGNDPSW
jgi:Tol biopolymer transport system component